MDDKDNRVANKHNDNRSCYKSSGRTRGREELDERVFYKSKGPAVAGKHRTIEQAIKVVGDRGRHGQDNRARYTSSGPKVSSKHMTIYIYMYIYIYI